MKVGDLIKSKWIGDKTVYIVVESDTDAYVSIYKYGQKVSVPKRHYEVVSGR